MNDQIWFIYLTDHHEGPFTPTEVAAKVTAGVVTPQSLGWKDGMAEWVPLESIPELAAALAPVASEAAPASAPEAAGGEEGFSLAQLLAQQQTESPSSAGISGSPLSTEPVTGNTSVLSSLSNPEPSVMSTGAPVSADMPAADDETWTLKIGAQVSGMHSINRLKALAGEGEIPPDAMLWRPGWSDFQPITTVPEVSSARRQRKMTSNQSGANTQATLRQGGGKTGMTNRPVFAPITAAADLGNDDPTDPSISTLSQPKGFKGLLLRVKGLMKRKQNVQQAKSTATKFTVKKPVGAMGDKIRRLGMLVGALVVVGGGAAAYFLLFSSPISSDLDVIPDDLESMRATVADSSSPKLYFAQARGTEENPADDFSPKFYVATSLPAGTQVNMMVIGKIGTLVGRITFMEKFFATVGDGHLAVFEKIQSEGKPVPAGEYIIKVQAEGAAPLTLEKFLGGKNGGPYRDRLKKFTEKTQGEYDLEMQDLREYIETMKSLHADVSKRLADHKTNWANAGNRPRITADWKAFTPGASSIITQLQGKMSARKTSGATIYQPRAFQDVTSTLAQLQTLIQAHEATINSQPLPAGANPSELDGLVLAGILSLEQFLTQALVKNPFDVVASSLQAPPASQNPPPGNNPSGAQKPAGSTP